MTQLDMFRDYDAEAAALSVWQAQIPRADWVAPWDCGYGPAGTVVQGWMCPACGKIEPNDYVLSINHGIDPYYPGCEGFLTECISMDLRKGRA